MSASRILLVSLSANLILAAAALWVWRTDSVGEPPEREIRYRTNPIARTRWLTNFVERTPYAPGTSNAWSAIEAEDYAEFVSNLRRAGCPEHVVRTVISSELEEHYDRLQKAIPVDHRFWITGEEVEARAQRHKSRKMELELDMLRAIEALVGLPWSSEAEENFAGQELAFVVSGFLEPSQAVAAVAVTKRFQTESALLRVKAGEIYTPKDEADIRTMAKEIHEALGGVCGAAGHEELRARIGYLLPLFNEGRAVGLRFTGPELRLLSLLRERHLNPLSSEIIDQDERLSETGKTQRREAFERDLEQRLGPAKLAEYRRGTDPGFHLLHEFAGKGDLPSGTDVRLYDVQQGVAKALLELARREDLTRDEKLKTAGRVRTEAWKEIERLLPREKFERFAREVGGKLPGKPLGQNPMSEADEP